MSAGDTEKASRAHLSSNRRTVSVDDYPWHTSNGSFHEKKTNGGLHNGQTHPITKQNSEGHAMRKQDSEDTYTCEPLPRTNNRPSAKSCWRRRSAFAPTPNCHFGPKCVLKRVQKNEQEKLIQDPSTQLLGWIEEPSHFLIIRKPDSSTLSEFQTLVEELLRRNAHIYIEPNDRQYLAFDSNSVFAKYAGHCHDFHTGYNMHQIDLIICLGGDGTLMHASSIYQKNCPPILAFSMGSLGFLTPFDFKQHEKILNKVLAGNVPLLLRARLSCTLTKADANLSSSADGTAVAKETTSLVFNEVVIDRGPNPYLSNLDLFINDRSITKVQGDGLIVSTPTGSTAYAMAAGASMVHPNVPSMIICPICPHSLSFRPIVVPAGIELTVKVADESRLTAWISVDGRNRLELQQGDQVKITTSVYPVPSICHFDQLGDWFESLAKTLHWNLRKPQLGFADHESAVEDDSSSVEEEEEKQTDEHENSPELASSKSSVETKF